MKKIRYCMSLILVCALFMATTTVASARASEQISQYYMYATAVSGERIAIDFTVVGVGEMKELGAESIYIYKYGTIGLEYQDHFTKSDIGMTAKNAPYFGNTIYYNAEAGEEYIVVVNIFAEDKNGNSDSRSKTFAVTVD